MDDKRRELKKMRRMKREMEVLFRPIPYDPYLKKLVEEKMAGMMGEEDWERMERDRLRRFLPQPLRNRLSFAKQRCVRRRRCLED